MLFKGFTSLLSAALWLIVQQIDGIQAAAWWERTSPKSITYKPNPKAKLTASYFFPYACTVVYLDLDFKHGHKKHPTWVSACTILTQNWVAASAENFNFLTPDTKYYYYHDMAKLQINAGTIYGTPSPTAKGLRNLQKLDVEKFFTLKDSGFINGEKSEVFAISGAPDRKKNMNVAVKKTALGAFEWGLAFLKVRKGFRWSPQVLPAPQIAEDPSAIKTKVKKYVARIETMGGNDNCVMAGWNRQNHRLGFYTVNYIPMEMCRSAFCQYDTRACLNFPDPDKHVCFKSVDYGSDACPEDRGSALYCHGFGQSVLAVLTTAPNCGLKNLPGVYTLIDRVVHAFGHSDLTEPVKNLPESELNRYTLPPAEFKS